MRHIVKRTPPPELTTFVAGGGKWGDTNRPATAMQESLLAEQDSLCAYCTRGIVGVSMGIEHHEPRSPANELQWRNLLGVCKVSEGKPVEEQTCDVRKANRAITINPLNEAHIRTLSYDSQAKLASSNLQFQNDIDHVLGLNVGWLVAERKGAWNGFLEAIAAKHAGTTWRAETVERMLGKSAGTEFCGCIEFKAKALIKQKKQQRRERT